MFHVKHLFRKGWLILPALLLLGSLAGALIGGGADVAPVYAAAGLWLLSVACVGLMVLPPAEWYAYESGMIKAIGAVGLGLFVALMAGCGSGSGENGYKLGDVSRAYCTNTTPELRAAFREVLLTVLGRPPIPQDFINYCVAVGVPLAMLHAIELAETEARLVPDAP